ncbi:MAG TPA: dihydroxyacetone kinase subunit DhaL [Roseiflexaceae bacterium]|nr:dihydroxyacetone kinase subunit DhaL [Roseiflexaceae bacterium]HMP38790.1 dihydroxyacetone kinase subunit DhaL [Roseiflexaceae bacterium]
MQITADHVIRFIQAAATAIQRHHEELTQLDAMIGDADHGTNLNRGFTAALVRLDELIDHDEADIGVILDATGRTLLATVGGAAGPLYGTAFRRAGAVLAGCRLISGIEILPALDAALDGIIERGHARLGDKTMVDAIAPGIAALRQALDHQLDLRSAVHAAVTASAAGMQATIEMRAVRGRAAFFGERSIGHQDPGATSAYYLALAMLEVLDA